MTTELNLMELTLITNHTILSFQYAVYIYCFPWLLGLTMGSTNKGINVEPMGINISYCDISSQLHYILNLHPTFLYMSYSSKPRTNIEKINFIPFRIFKIIPKFNGTDKDEAA